MNDPSIIRNTAHVDFNDENLDNVRFVKVNKLPAVREHFTPNFHVDQVIYHSVDQPLLVKNSQNNDFSNHNLTKINSITLNTQAVNENQVNTMAYVDQFHQDNERSRRDLGLYFYNKSSDLVKNIQNVDKKFTNLDIVAVNINPSSDNELANKKYVYESLGSGNIQR